MSRFGNIRAISITAMAFAASASLVMVAGGAQAAPDVSARYAAPFPAHFSAPYFETWTGDSPAQLALESGNKYLTLAFLQTEAPGSCIAYWNGDTKKPISPFVFGVDVVAIQALGGDVVPSFGGGEADNIGTEIADSCTDVDAIAAVYERVFTTYGVRRIDLDIEGNSLKNNAAIDRRNKAIAQVEKWAAARGRAVEFAYTLPTNTTGIDSYGLAVLQNAVSNGARVDLVNIMTFDYYDGHDPHDMAADTLTAAAGTLAQLATLYPSKTSAELWHLLGVTEMPGVDDYGTAETFTTADAITVEKWAESKGLGALSFWALQRDNGDCTNPDACSHIEQRKWYFSHVFEKFTSRR